jgi:hypothetical protein
MTKQQLNWIPQLFENYKKVAEKSLEKHQNPFATGVCVGKIKAADDLLSLIKQFIKDANQLQGK